MTLRDRYDAVVIGAGPAGGAAAIVLASSGVSVLLAERCGWPRPKVCGCCLAAAGVESLQDLGVPSPRAVRLDRAAVRAGGQTAAFTTPGIAVIRREALDAAIVERAAAAGAEFLPRASARAFADGRVRLLTDGHSIGVRAASIIVADGLAGSSVAHIDAMRPRVSTFSRMGLGAILDVGVIRDAGLDADAVNMLVGRRGYVGLVRDANGRFIAGAAVPPRAVRESGPAAAVLGCIRDALGREPDRLLRGAVGDVAWRGTPLLTRTRAREHGRILVAGDAAAYAEPFTGGGMTWAVRSGIGAAGHALEMIAERYAPGAWTRAHGGTVGDALTRCRLVSTLLRAPMLAPAALRACGFSGSIRAAAAGIALGPRHGAAA
ncbi:MAG TPA: FAD-dependent monooxygenase [Phycisphaerales bacterium]|nr:FAD-dependent monooxygenase [Phycisphaerales bacterium]